MQLDLIYGNPVPYAFIMLQAGDSYSHFNASKWVKVYKWDKLTSIEAQYICWFPKRILENSPYPFWFYETGVPSLRRMQFFVTFSFNLPNIAFNFPYSNKLNFSEMQKKKKCIEHGGPQPLL